MAGHGARGDRHHRGGAPAGARCTSTCMVGRTDVRPVRRRRREARANRRREGQPRADCGWPATTARAPDRDRRAPRGKRGPRGRARARGHGRRQRARTPEPVSTSSSGSTEGLLPAIVFIFSRAGCDAAVTAVPERGPAADHAPRSATRSSPSSRTALPHLPDEDLHVLGYHEFLDGLSRGVAAHHAGMLPTFKEVVEELFVARPVQGGLRHRDLGPGHQHAGPLRGDREAVEVERRDPRRHHAGGVHPAHRPGRTARHRRRGPRRRALAAGHRPAGRWPGWPRPAPTRCGRPSVRRTTWRSTWSTSSAGPAPASCWSRPSPSSRPTRPWSGLARQLRKARRRSTGYAEAATCHLGDFMEYAAAAPDAVRGGGGRGRRPPQPTGARRSSSRWRRCGPVT